MLARILLITALIPPIHAGCLQVTGRSITAGDLGTNIPQFKTLPARTHLLTAPWFGSRRVLQRQEILRLGLNSSVQISDAPDDLCVEQAAVTLDLAHVRKVVEQTLAAMRRAESISVSIVDFNPKRVPHGDLILTPAGLMSACAAGTCNLYRWRGTVRSADGQSIPIKIVLRLEVPQTVAIAQHPFRVGEKISPSGFVLAERRVPWRPGLGKSKPDPVGKVVKRIIREGEVISNENLRSSRDVESGEAVDIHVHSGKLILVTQTVAITGGNQGERVILRNPTTKRNLAAIVTGPAKAETVAKGELD